jgi:hypothetical protein
VFSNSDNNYYFYRAEKSVRYHGSDKKSLLKINFMEFGTLKVCLLVFDISKTHLSFFPYVMTKYEVR